MHSGYELVHNGPGREFVADNLLPGRVYRVCVCCVAADKQSDVSINILAKTTLCMSMGLSHNDQELCLMARSTVSLFQCFIRALCLMTRPTVLLASFV